MNGRDTCGAVGVERGDFLRRQPDPRAFAVECGLCPGTGAVALLGGVWGVQHWHGRDGAPSGGWRAHTFSMTAWWKSKCDLV